MGTQLRQEQFVCFDQRRLGPHREQIYLCAAKEHFSMGHNMEITIVDATQHIIDRLRVDMPKNANIKVGRPAPHRSLSPDDALTVVITLVGTIPINLLSSWLYDAIKNTTSQIKINKKDIPPELAAISQAIATQEGKD